MDISIHTLLDKAMKLPEDQRLVLANRLLAVPDTDASSEIQSAWDSEICSRIAKYDRGEISSRSLSDVFSALDRQL